MSNIPTHRFKMLYDTVDDARAKDMLVVAAAHNNADDNDVAGSTQMFPAR